MKAKTNVIEIDAIYSASIAMMNKYFVSLTPENYTLFFAYFSAENDDIVKSIDRTMAKGEPFSEEYLDSLYHELLGYREDSKLSKIGLELHEAIEKVFNQVNMIHGASGKLSDRVSQSIHHLSEKSSYGDIVKAVTIISEEAREMGEVSDSMRSELTEMSGELETVRKELKTVNQETRIDHLTSIPNRLGLDETLEKMIAQGDFSVLMIDIDFFKKFNDSFGHLVGDKVLKFVARQISNRVKGNDFAARFGGEEFVVLLPETELKGAVALAENLRKYFEKAKLKGGADTKDFGKISISIGAAYYKSDETAEEILERADIALYKAKENGRNRVEQAN